MQPFTSSSYHQLCDRLAADDADLQNIVDTYGYPPFWSRPNTFETLVHIILEQQVSLASAKAALEKLRERIGAIKPEAVLALSDDDLKSAYFSRQKATYVRGLAQAIVDDRLDLIKLGTLSDNAVRTQLTALKGIGNWTTDIYLIMVLHRPDVFPFGDLAAIKALRTMKGLDAKADTSVITDSWKPYRSIATMLLWHYYLSAPKIK